MDDLTTALYAFGIGVVALGVLAAVGWLAKFFPDEDDDKDESHFD